MRPFSTALALCLFTVSASAWAQERDYCPARPGLGTPACTIAPGRVSVETGIADWQRHDNSQERTDAVVIADTLVRIGLSGSVEAQLGWTPFGRIRSHDKASGRVETANRIGDMLVGLKANFTHPEGSGFSFAVQPFGTLPVGRGPLGAGDWGAGVVAPTSLDLSDKLNLQFSPEIDAAPDEDRKGRHFAISGTAGLGYSFTDAVGATVEFQALHDDDPGGRSTQLLGALSLSWAPADDLQLDAGTSLGLDRDAADMELYVGISRQF